MAKGTRGRRGLAARNSRLTPYPSPSYKETESMQQNNCSEMFEKKDWEDATCSVCMECPHNAVLLLCSSHEKGCRPYMCGTSLRYSNCLDQYKKAYTKASENRVRSKAGRLWTVHENISMLRNGAAHRIVAHLSERIKELRKHVRAEHPSSNPREVDPTLEQKWRRLERERETEDVRSTIRSSTPGAVFFGDYVIEGGRYGNFSEDEGGLDAGAVGRNGDFMSVFLLLQAFGSAGNVGPNRGIGWNGDDDDAHDAHDDDDHGSYDTSLAGRHVKVELY
ncbi:hypothetical protein DH2020_045105 [Rehmannia glutinosa]|uniref:Uncharacterized protein n=1 Tax=Rehmannia glutinosa TaxID=99300 RepID=A0ABR0UFT5_REHGL